MLDTFVCGSGFMLVLAKLLEIPPIVAVPTAIAGALAVTVDVARELEKLNAAKKGGERDRANRGR